MARPEAGLVVFFYMYSNSRAYRADVKTVTHHTVHTRLSCDVRHGYFLLVTVTTLPSMCATVAAQTMY